MLIRTLINSILIAVALVGTAMADNDPSLHQVYEAVQAGHYSEAQTMMDKVLHDHPNSGKAHFVEAELLAKQGRLSDAASELSTAERLAPGLLFAKPESVEELKRHIAGTRLSTTSKSAPAYAAQPQSAAGLPWGMILLGIALIAAVIFFIRSLTRRNNVTVIPAGGGTAYGPGYGSGMGTGVPMQSYGGGSVMPPMGGPMGGGMGSGILGGLATGAAVGAGMVAGEALMHHFTDGNHPNTNTAPVPGPAQSWDTSVDDMGGNDFGIADNTSWDDSSSVSGGDDWN